MGENARFKNGHARVETRVFKNTSVSKKCQRFPWALVDSVPVRFKSARVEKMPLYICIQWNAGTGCVSECVLKTLACRGLHVGPSKIGRHLVVVWIGGVWNGHFPESEKYFSEAEISRKIPELPQKERFSPNFRLRNLKIQSPQKRNSIPPAIPYPH